MGAYRVVVADDDAAVRSALADSLDGDARFTVVATASTGREACDLAEEAGAEVVLLDVRMPGGGVDAARTLAARRPAPVVVAVSAGSESGTVVAMVAAGAAGYLAKGRLGAGLPDLVARCVAGERVLAVPNADAVLRALDDAQRRVGVGRGRPRVGRRTVTG